ncbi:GNAT family N-acetyltransferase [Hamadaea sp. NPDC051192]|uniref:GNAT family N-acetyltransferase n=1 Tax=Hamadaea sp. NPDC051192 TaxID=3154940 RepID=UPI0034295687
MTTIIDAPPGTGEDRTLAAIIGEAFSHLAVSRHLIPDHGARAAVLARHLGQNVELARGIGRLLTDTERRSAAVWLAVPDTGLPDVVGYEQRRAAACGPHTGRFTEFEDRMHKNHPLGKHHWYLALMAVHPDQQGQGLGSTLLRHQLVMLDRSGQPAYLEAADPRSRRLYLRHGFSDHGQPFACGHAGPFLWPMWREPRTGQPATSAVSA